MVKDILRNLVPPILWSFLHRLRAGTLGGGPEIDEYEHVLESWDYARTHPDVKGWNVQDVLETYKRKWPRFVEMVEGTGLLGIAHESSLVSNEDINSHNTTMAFGYVLAMAAHRKDALSMLDWGGGIGHYYLLAQTLLPEVVVEYHCKDVPLLAEYGAELFPDQYFYADESCLERTYDFVTASTSLHYSQDWQRVLSGLARATQGYLYVTHLPTVLGAPSFVFVQRPYAYGYNTEYLGWCLNRNELLECAAQAGVRLVREFICGHRPYIHKAPEQNEYRGFLFRH